MFKERTVFVIGAGASHEFGFPVGGQLMSFIQSDCAEAVKEFNSLRTDRPVLVDHFHTQYQTLHDEDTENLHMRQKALKQISEEIESAESIDEYIFRNSHQPTIAEVGKLCIALRISQAEQRSIIHHRKNFSSTNVDSAHKTWIWTFFKSLISGYETKNVERIGENIEIICFNYDRCIQHYLETALKKYFSEINALNAREIVKSIRIYHPYGSLGRLDEFPFGEVSKFPEMADNIVTWSETIREEDTVAKMKRAILKAEQIIFLGFGFANQNMNLLRGDRNDRVLRYTRVYSTAYGLRSETERSYKNNIADLYSSNNERKLTLDNIHFQYHDDGMCAKFFEINRANFVK